VVVQDDHGAMLGREAPECPIQGIAIVDRDGLVRPGRPVDREGSDVRAPPPVPAELLVTGVHEKSMEPDLEALRISQPRELAPGEEECLLDGVLGPLRIAQDAIRDRVAEVAVEIDELTESGIVPFASLFDQPRPHVAVLHGHPMGASLTTDGRTGSKVQ